LSTSGLVISSLGFLLLAQIGQTVTFDQLLPSLVLVGSGMGLFAAPNRASIMNSVPPPARGVASGISTTLILLGTTFSLGIAFLVLSFRVSIANLDQIFLSLPTKSNPPWVGGFIDAIHSVYFLSAGFLLIAIFLSVFRNAYSAR
jgi:hypothetical protein